VPSRIQGLRNQRVLERGVLGAARAESFIHRPTDGAVIDDAVVGEGHAHAVKCLSGHVAGPNADIADDYIVRGVEAKVVLAKANAFAWRGLSGEGGKGVSNDQPRLQGDESGNVEYDRARPVRFNGGAQATGIGIVEICHMNDAAPRPPRANRP